MKPLYVCSLATVILAASCTAYKPTPPAPLQYSGDKMHVKGTGISVIGHKIKIAGFGEGRMYSSFSSGSTREKRLFPLYFDLDARMRYISNHFSKEITRSKTRFRFDVAKGTIYANTYAEVHSSETALDIKKGNWGIPLSETYRFTGLIYTNQEATPWRLEFAANKNIKNGLDDLVTNIHHTDGLLTNGKEQVLVQVVPLQTTGKRDKAGKPLLPIAAGYAFVKDNRQVAYADLFGRNIWVDKSVDELTRVVLVSAATSLLVKMNAG